MADPEDAVAEALGFNRPAVVVADRFGEIWAAWEADADHCMPDEQEIVEWLDFIEIQCPECHPPESWGSEFGLTDAASGRP